MKHACKHPPKHVAAVMAFLREIGAVVAEVVSARCHRVAFLFGGLRFHVSVCRSEAVADAVRKARFEVHRKLHQVGLTLPVLA